MRRRDFVIMLLGASMLCSRKAPGEQRSIGFLSAGSPDAYAPFVTAFRAGITDEGYIEGRNVAIEYRWGEGRVERLAEIAAELVRLKVDVIVTSGTRQVVAAQQATSVIGHPDRVRGGG